MIFCKECKYCYWTDESSYAGDFSCRLYQGYDFNFYQTYKTHTKCEDKNKKNDCKDFKKKIFVIF